MIWIFSIIVTFLLFRIFTRLDDLSQRLDNLESLRYREIDKPEEHGAVSEDAQGETEDQVELAPDARAIPLLSDVPPPPPSHPSKKTASAVDVVVEQEPQIEEALPVSEKKGMQFSEENIGAKLFPLIGGIAIIFGVGFFLKFAIDQGWLTEAVRVFMGYVLGISFVVLGEKLRKKYAEYSYLLSGIGVALLYLITFGAYSWYGLIPQPIAFFLAAIFSALGVFLALRYDAVVLAGMGFAGGYLAPFLLAPDSNNPYGLFSYITIVTCGLIVVALQRSWTSILWGGFIGTSLVYAAWHARFYDETQWFVALIFSSLYFLLYTMLGTGYFTQAVGNWKGAISKEDQLSSIGLFLGAVGLFYFFVGYDITNIFSKELSAWFAVSLAVFYAILSYVSREVYESEDASRIFVIFSALSFAVAPPIGYTDITLAILWVIQAIGLVAIGVIVRSLPLRFLGISLAILAAVHAMVGVGFDGIVNEVAFINNRFVSRFFAAGAFAVIGALYNRFRDRVLVDFESNEQKLMQAVEWFFVVSAAVYYLSGIHEVSTFFDGFWLTPFIAIFSAALLVLSFLTRFHLLAQLATFFVWVLIPLRALPVLLQSPASEYSIVNRDVLELAIIILIFFVTAYAVRRSDDSDDGLKIETVFPMYPNALVIAGIFLVYLAGFREIDGYFEAYWYTFYTAFVSLVLIAVGERISMPRVEKIGHVVLFLLAFWVVLTSRSRELVSGGDALPFANFVFFEFVVASLSLYFAVYMSRAFFAKDEDWQSMGGALYLAAHILSIWGVSLEINNLFEAKILQARMNNESVEYLGNMRNVFQSVWWMIYAIAALFAGIIRKSKITRLVGITLLWITIFKVFLFDTASLDTFYRFVSFITLGVILLVTGYLYNKHREKIREFLSV